MQHYELLCVLPGTLTEEEVKPVMENIKELLTKNEAENIAVTDLGKSRLAYPINHIRYGYFQLAQFELNCQKVKNVNGKLRVMTELLRAHITKYNPVIREENDKKRGQKITLETLSKIERDVESPRPSFNKPVRKEVKKKETEKVALEDIDKNLDKILESDLEKI